MYFLRCQYDVEPTFFVKCRHDVEVIQHRTKLGTDNASVFARLTSNFLLQIEQIVNTTPNNHVIQRSIPKGTARHTQVDHQVQQVPSVHANN